MGVTLFITVISVAIELVLGMIIALVMHRAIFGRGPVRAAVLIPYGIVTVVAAFTWKYAFDPTSGFVQGLPLVPDDYAPLNTQAGSLLIIILAEVWKTTPFMALLLLAGLALVPDELHEAAKVDGASAVQRFFRITVPLMKPGDPGGACCSAPSTPSGSSTARSSSSRAAPTAPRRCRSWATTS